jgi:hypothetical protein
LWRMRRSCCGMLSAKAVLQRSMREARKGLRDDMMNGVWAEEALSVLPGGQLCCVNLC